MAPYRMDDSTIKEQLGKSTPGQAPAGQAPAQPAPKHAETLPAPAPISVDVVIAGSGPIGAAFARTILEKNKDPNLKVLMVEVGSQDDRVVGRHHKNSIKFQKDIDAFVNVIKGALQPVSVPPSDSYIPTLGGDGWAPTVHQKIFSEGSNPSQNPQVNLKDCAVTRTVGGMATHWTASCPTPHENERVNNPIPKAELEALLKRAEVVLNVHRDEYNGSIRHTVVKETLLKTLEVNGENVRNIQNIPLAVKRREDNSHYVTWTGVDTVLGDTIKDPRFQLLTETRVTRLIPEYGGDSRKFSAFLARDLSTDSDILITARAFVVACGSVLTPQILWNSEIDSPALGRNLAEQSLSFCQIVLKDEIVESIYKDARFKEKVAHHKLNHPHDPLPIPFSDAEPQVMIPYTPAFPWHCQIHRDAFSYGDVGPRADPRVVVDLRFFYGQEINWENRVLFTDLTKREKRGWKAGVTDIYGMPQPTFNVQRSHADRRQDHKMMEDMTTIANKLGAFLPGSAPQFMNPGLALHITGTTRIGTNPEKSVADAESKVHGYANVWVGGNGNIPDATCSNPTLTSVAIALKAAESIVEFLKTPV